MFFHDICAPILQGQTQNQTPCKIHPGYFNFTSEFYFVSTKISKKQCGVIEGKRYLESEDLGSAISFTAS